MNPNLLPSPIDTSASKYDSLDGIAMEGVVLPAMNIEAAIDGGTQKAPIKAKTAMVTFPSLSHSSSTSSGGILNESEDEYIRRHMNIFTQFKDPTIRQEYITFAGFRKSTSLFFFVNTFFTVILLHAISSAIKYQQSENCYAKLNVLSYLSLICTALTVFAGWMLLYCQHYGHQIEHNLMIRICTPYRHYLQYLFYVSAVLCYSFRIIQRTYTGQCPAHLGYLMNTWNCNPYGDSNAFPTESMVILMLIPFTFTTIMRETRMDVLLLSWFISSTALIICAVKLGSAMGLPVVLPYVVFSLFIIIDISSQNLHMFFINRKLREMMEANERMAEQVKQNELRSMIANVAHDLKTVSATLVPLYFSFLTRSN